MKSEKKKYTWTLKTSFGLYYQNILFKECSFYQRVNKKKFKIYISNSNYRNFPSVNDKTIEMILIGHMHTDDHCKKFVN